MTDWVPRGSQDLNRIYSSTSLALPTYAPNGGVNNYPQTDGHLQYPHMGSTYPTYSTTYMHNAHNNLMYMPTNSLDINYHMSPVRTPGVASRPQTVSRSQCYGSTTQGQRSGHQPIRYHVAHEISWVDIEDQDSINQETQRSEPINPPLEGYPDVEEFDRLMHHYVANLSPKKQDKALIHAKRAANIKAVLIDKKTTSVESAQFRFWVKKMFTLYPNDSNTPTRKKKICHDSKPVAVREKLFKILTRAHKLCQHGGRDKTSAQVRKVYSWVPKELISRFVKICPTCQVRRGTSRGSHDSKSPDTYAEPSSPSITSPTQSCQESPVLTRPIHPNLQMPQFSTTFQHQNRWMTSIQPHHDPRDEDHKPESTTQSATLHDSLPLNSYHNTNNGTQSTASQPSYASMSPEDTMGLAAPRYPHSHIPHFDSEDIEYRIKCERHY